MRVSRVLIDTNVILDLLLARQPFDREAIALASVVAGGGLTGYVSATSVTTVHYLASKHLGARGADGAVEDLLAVFAVAPVTEGVLRAAIERRFDDFEDAVIDAAAEHVEADAIITRDTTGFRRSRRTVLSPIEALSAIAASGRGGST